MLDDSGTPSRKPFRFLRAAFVAAVVSGLGLALSAGGDEPAEAAPGGASTLDGVFTVEQVEGIASTYDRDCAACHGDELGGSASAPPLTGLPFMFFWEGKSLGELYAFVHENMPLGNPGSLSDQQYADLVALILSTNGFPAGESRLVADVEMLEQVVIAPAPASGGE